jgi:hypothetical protein
MTKQTHRELMYDRNTSGRRFKRFHRMSTSGSRVEEAWSMGSASVASFVPKHWQTNPYPPGRRHDMYEQGQRDTLHDMGRKY